MKNPTLLIAVPRDNTGIKLLRPYVEKYGTEEERHAFAPGQPFSFRITDVDAALLIWDFVRHVGLKRQCEMLEAFLVAQGVALPEINVTAASPLYDLNLDTTTYFACKREGIHTVGALIAHTEASLTQAVRVIGALRIARLRAKLADHGLKLSGE